MNNRKRGGWSTSNRTPTHSSEPSNSIAGRPNAALWFCFFLFYVFFVGSPVALFVIGLIFVMYQLALKQKFQIDKTKV